MVYTKGFGIAIKEESLDEFNYDMSFTEISIGLSVHRRIGGANRSPSWFQNGC